MKKQFKYVALAAVLAAASLAPAFGSEAKVSGKWVNSKKGYWYRFSDGSYAEKEWINGYWIRANGYWDGVKTKAKWIKTDGKWMYGYGDWCAKKKWQKIDGDWYYFDADGYLLTDQFFGGYKFAKSGKMVDSGYGWHQTKDGKWWYGKSGKSGEYVKDGWFKIATKIYHFDEKGYLDVWTIKWIDGTVFSFDSSGNPKAQTHVVPSATIEGSIEFTITDKNKKDAAEDMDLFLTMATEPGTTKVMYVDGVAKTIKHVEDETQGDYIAIDDEPLVEYVARCKTKKVVVTGSGSTQKLFNALSVVGLADGANYNYKVKIGNSTFSKFAVTDEKMTFSVDGSNYKALIALDTMECWFHTDVTGKPFYQALVDAGVISGDVTQVFTMPFPGMPGYEEYDYDNLENN